LALLFSFSGLERHPDSDAAAKARRIEIFAMDLGEKRVARGFVAGLRQPVAENRAHQQLTDELIINRGQPPGQAPR